MTNPVHEAAWLEDVRSPGPNGVWFAQETVADPFIREVQHVGASRFIMEDDVTTSLFTPGCGAYAGYSAGAYSNMTKVRAYAASQRAGSFAYSGIASQLSGADAIDMEPGLASVGDAPAAYHSGIRYFYASASQISSVISTLSSHGITRTRYKVISAHYIGSHICGPATCGYPLADATQFTESYLGRSLDATLCPADFFGTPPPTFPIGLNATGTTVVAIQKNLNRWATVIHLSKPLVTDGDFGGLTQSAVKLFQAYAGQSTTGLVSQSLYNTLAGPLPVNPDSWVFGPVRSLKLLNEGQHSFKVSFYTPGTPMPLGVGWYQCAISRGTALGANISGYPRVIPKGTASLTTWQGGGLSPNTSYVAAFRAVATDGKHAAKWTTVKFKTPA